MNFINDHITDEDRKRFDFSVFKRAPLLKQPLHMPTIWTVDRETGVFLLPLGGHGPAATEEDFQKGVQYFSLWWRGVNVECKLWNEAHAPNGITWKKDWIDVPDEYLKQREEVYQAIREALTVFQTDGDAFRLSFGDPSLPPLSEIKFDF